MTMSLATTETAPLSSETLRRLRRLLVEERKAQAERIVAHVNDEAAAGVTVEWELAPVLAAGARQAVDEIDEALARLDADTFGWCKACREPLPLARLEAIPHARFCVACQAGRDPAPRRE